MLAGLIIALAVAAIAVAVAAVTVLQRVTWRRLERRHAVVVMLDTVTTLEGVLYERRGPLLVLRNVTIYTAQREQGTPADGEVVIERDQVAWIQVTS